MSNVIGDLETLKQHDVAPKQKPLVPEITADRAKELSKKYKPVVRKNGKLYNIKLPDLFRVAFTWDPKTTSEAEGLVEVGHITTYHEAGYILFFKPSLSEVYAQLDADKHIPEDVCAFHLATSEPEVKLHTHDIPGFYGQSSVLTLYAKREQPSRNADGSIETVTRS